MARFEDVAKSFWDATATYGVPPPLTDQLVAETEAGLNVKLPEDLLMLLRLQNGGAVSRAWERFPSPPNFYGGDFVPFRFMYGVGPPGGTGDDMTLPDTPQVADEWGSPMPFVLLYDERQWRETTTARSVPVRLRLLLGVAASADA